MRFKQLLNQNYEKFSDNDREICRYLLEHEHVCARASIGETAEACHVSKTVLVRFSKKLGLPGYRELKAMLKLEEMEQNSSAKDLLKELTGNYHKMLEDLKEKDCAVLFGKMRRAKRILVFGSGYAQARAASEFKRIFLPTGKSIFHIHGDDMVDSFAELAEKEDLVFIISLSGESKAVIRLAEGLRMKGVSLVSVTHMKNNTLAQLCGENLYINSMSLTNSTGSRFESSTPYFILIELLFLKYQLFMENEQSF